MGPPPRRPARGWRRLADPRAYLKIAIAGAFAGLLALPVLADLAGAARRLAADGGGGCTILNVIDGDTATLWCPGAAPERARLLGFDTPEKFSPGCAAELLAAERATWALRWMLFRAADVRVSVQGRDRYGRPLAEVVLDGTRLSRQMIGMGLARPYDGGRRAGWCA